MGAKLYLYIFHHPIRRAHIGVPISPLEFFFLSLSLFLSFTYLGAALEGGRQDLGGEILFFFSIFGFFTLLLSLSLF